MAFNSRRPSSAFPRRELFRLVSMMMLLGVVGLMMYQARDPAMWRWFADDAGPEAAQKKTPVKSSEKESFVETLVTGPNELQPFEQSQAEYVFQAVSDKSPLTAEEMPAYWKLMRWSMTQSFDELWERAHKDRYFTHLAEAPHKHRGELVAMKVSLRRFVAHPDQTEENSAGAKKVYEVWGVTDESRTGLYSLVFYDKPPQIPEKHSIHEEAVFVGYFLKLMAYEDTLGTSRWAPLLIGRLRWRENPTRSALQRQRAVSRDTWPWILGGVAVGALILGVWTRSYLNAVPMPSTEAPVNHAAVEQWLESGAESVVGEDASAQANFWAEVADSDEEPRPESLPNLDSNSPSGDAADEKPT